MEVLHTCRAEREALTTALAVPESTLSGMQLKMTGGSTRAVINDSQRIAGAGPAHQAPASVITTHAFFS